MKYKLARINAGLSQIKAALLMDISVSFLSKIERDVKVPGRNTILKMRKVYRCSFEDLF